MFRVHRPLPLAALGFATLLSLFPAVVLAAGAETAPLFAPLWKPAPPAAIVTRADESEEEDEDIA